MNRENKNYKNFRKKVNRKIAQQHKIRGCEYYTEPFEFDDGLMHEDNKSKIYRKIAPQKKSKKNEMK